MPQQQDCRGFPVSPCLYGSGGLMCACGARWTLSWVHECGLFCRLHLGLHMVQQTAVREAGGHVGGGHPSSGFSYIYTHWQGIAAEWQTERLRDDPARQMLLWVLTNMVSFSVLNFLCGSNSLLFPSVRGVFACPLFGYAMYTRWEQFGEQCLAQGHSNVDKRSGDWAATPMINGRAPELQLPVIWTCHHISILSHLLWFIVVTYDRVAGRQCEGNAVRHEKTTLKQLVN